jgi:hypothetical protein
MGYVFEHFGPDGEFLQPRLPFRNKLLVALPGADFLIAVVDKLLIHFADRNVLQAQVAVIDHFPDDGFGQIVLTRALEQGDFAR